MSDAVELKPVALDACDLSIRNVYPLHVKINANDFQLQPRAGSHFSNSTNSLLNTITNPLHMVLTTVQA